MKKISLIVLNYNGVSLLKKYFDSVFQQSEIPAEIIFFDNHSSDSSASFVTKNYPKVKIVRAKQNHGTAAGSNMAFPKTKGDLVIFQSNDIRLDKNAVKELVLFMDKHPEAGVCSSVLLKKNTKVIDNAGGICDIFGYPMQKYPNVRIEEVPETGEVFFSYGGSFIVRREIFQKLRGFDPRFFTLNDDLDFCWRVRQLGYKIFYTKKSFVYHDGSATLKKIFDRPKKHYWSERNMLCGYLKNQHLIFLLIFFPGYLFLLFSEMFYFLYRLKISLFFSDLQAIFWNLFNLPGTILLRLKMTEYVKKTVGLNEFSMTSFKLKLFQDFKNAL